MAAAARNTRQYGNDFEYNATLQQPIDEQPCRIFVIDGDCLDAVMFFKNKYPRSNPVVLNMASRNHPGGGWKNGISYSIYSMICDGLIFFRCWCTRRKSSSSYQYVSMS